MSTFFLVCAGLGAIVLVVQIVLSLFGLDHHHGLAGGFHSGDAGMGEGLELFSVRSISAGMAFYGLGGLAGLSVGLPGVIAATLALVPGVAAVAGTALLMRQVLRLESSGTIQIEGSVGSPATVYLKIPAANGGPGKVHVALQGRTVELQAITRSDSAIPTGASVVVVSVVDSDTVEVLPTSIVEEVLHDSR